MRAVAVCKRVGKGCRSVAATVSGRVIAFADQGIGTVLKVGTSTRHCIVLMSYRGIAQALDDATLVKRSGQCECDAVPYCT